MSKVMMYGESEGYNGVVAGIDEAGRGCIFGGVFSASVILDPFNPIDGLNDSKKLSARRREALYTEIMDKALYVGIGYASPYEIDTYNISVATMLSMKRAYFDMDFVPDLLVIDGREDPHINVKTKMFDKGDSRFQEISAGSIVAKVERDRYMDKYHELNPEYGFDRHRGYGTAEHYKMLRKHGLVDGYRLSFRGVK